jgi:hypothetical protein
MFKAIFEAIKQEAKIPRLVANALVVVLVLWVLIIMKKNSIAKQINPLEA